jgi:predicted nucleotidyltransferase
MSASGDVDVLTEPDDETVNRAVADFARAVKAAYGNRLKGLYLFGSRARGDHTRESDADIAVVLADGNWDYWAEKTLLAGLEYDVIVATGAEPQGWPVRETEWLDPALHRNPALVTAMRRDAKPIEVLA